MRFWEKLEDVGTHLWEKLEDTNTHFWEKLETAKDWKKLVNP